MDGVELELVLLSLERQWAMGEDFMVEPCCAHLPLCHHD